MMKQHRAAFWLVPLLVFPFVAPCAHFIQAALRMDIDSGTQQSTQSQEQSKASTEAIAEAAQLSRTVVKLFNEGKYDKALPLAKRAQDKCIECSGTKTYDDLA
ncbi:MAG: hypothetical protein ABJA18_13775 [bacterium]